MKKGFKRTFVKTAMDAYELPRLIPTMEGVEASTGALMHPFGRGPFGSMMAMFKTSWTIFFDSQFYMAEVSGRVC